MTASAVANDSLPEAFSVPRELKISTADGAAATKARVLTWNIDRGTELEDVKRTLSGESAQLCLLQEVDWNTARTGERDVAGELARYLHMNFAYGIEFEELGQEHGQPAYIGQATLTTLPLRSSRILRFEHQSGFWQPHSWLPSKMPLMQRRIGDRIALITELTFAHRPLVVYNAHLESRSMGRIQSEQLDEMLADCRRYPPETAVILGGDLNTKYLPSVFLHKLEGAGFRSATGERIERTHKIAMTLDWIFARGPVSVSGGRVEKNARGSDHYPVEAELQTR